MLYILSGIKRSENQWVYRIVDSVKKLLILKRIDFIESPNIDETVKKCAETAGVIMLPLCMNSDTFDIVKKCSREGVQVILPNAILNSGEQYRCHCIQGDIYGTVSNIIKTFKSNGKQRIALYGPNDNSQNDMVLVDAFTLRTGEGEGSVFYNEGGSAIGCYEAFLSAPLFDAVICANDYVAYHLIENLGRDKPEYLKTLSVISFSNTMLSKLCRTPFTSLDLDLVSIANAVADIYRMVNKEKKYYRGVTVYVDYHVHERETTKGISFKNLRTTIEDEDILYPSVPPYNVDKIYDSSYEISRLANIDLTLNKLSKGDLWILSYVLRKYTRNQISEASYLSLEAVNYHLKKMREAFGCRTTNEMYDKLNSVLSAEYIENFLKESQTL